MMNSRVAIAMSGGVDSSTAAAMLKSQGYDLVGFSMQLWNQALRNAEENEAAVSRCCSLDDLYDARAVAARLKFPYYVVNYEREFRASVIRTFIEEYCNGYTPSPCVLCNSHLKFDLLIRLAGEVEADRLATGHYARVRMDPSSGRYLLLRGRDLAKDQSYFLFELKQDQLARAMFPLGDLDKSEVRTMARHHGLSVAGKPESQEICFIPDGEYASFIERNYEAVLGEERKPDAFRAGEIVDSSGKVLGKHSGVHQFTVGQRRGLGIAHSTPLYVVAVNPLDRRVVVGERSELARNVCQVVRLNWISIPELHSPSRVLAQIRSRHQAAPAAIFPLSDGSVRVVFDEPQLAITPGQACVFYDGEAVVGGGWIERDP